MLIFFYADIDIKWIVLELHLKRQTSTGHVFVFGNPEHIVRDAVNMLSLSATRFVWQVKGLQ